jgi:hypothetical protein
MRTFDLKPATRENVPLLLGLVGASGSGKTMSALELAVGIQSVVGGKIAAIDTESRRMLHYADKYKFDHIDFKAPFDSRSYLAALTHCVDSGAKIVIVDQMSSEHDGEGGMIDSQDQELTRMAGNDYAKRERCKMLAWVKPKQARRALVSGILQLNANFIFNFRAKQISKPVKVEGKTEVVPQGFVPIAGDELVFEMTACALLLPKCDGVPTWQSDYPGERMAMKLPQQFRGLLDDGRPLSRDHGRKLAEWASSGAVNKVAELLAKYASAATEATFADLESQRKAIWASASAGEKVSLKSASDAAKDRLAKPATPPVQEHIFGVDDPSLDPANIPL